MCKKFSRVTLVSPQDFLEKTSEKYSTTFTDKIENSIAKPPRSKKKSKQSNVNITRLRAAFSCPLRVEQSRTEITQVCLTQRQRGEESVCDLFEIIYVLFDSTIACKTDRPIVRSRGPSSRLQAFRFYLDRIILEELLAMHFSRRTFSRGKFKKRLSKFGPLPINHDFQRTVA